MEIKTECKTKRTAWNKGLVGYNAGEKSHLWKGGKTIGICEYCGETFGYWESSQKGKYCSKTCSNRANAKTGKDNPTWTEEPKYNAIHAWVREYKEPMVECSRCGESGEDTVLHWANVDHEYRRNLDDYICLCVKCHCEYDRKFNNKRWGKYEKLYNLV